MRFFKYSDVRENAVVCKKFRDLLLRLRSTYGTGSVVARMLYVKGRWLVFLS